MTSLFRWVSWRPGFIVPVFFLSCFQASAQYEQEDARVSGAGSCFMAREGIDHAACNQAGLGCIRESGVALHHSRPFLLEDLGISTLSAYLPVGKGGFGGSLGSAGVPGFRHTSVWLAYGTRLSPLLTAGVGFHFWNHGIEGQAFFHSGAGCALGVQLKASDRLTLGAHVRDPFAWSDLPGFNYSNRMEISAGLAWTFLESASFFSELHLAPSSALQWCNGLELHAGPSLGFLFGMHNRPFVLSGGMSMDYRNLILSLAAAYCFDTGCIPSASLSYGW
jgi:hypothetical protein